MPTHDELNVLQGLSMRVLLLGNKDGSLMAWHPELGEFTVTEAVPNKRGGKQKRKHEKYSEADVMVKIKSFAPLEFESVISPEENYQ